jgi:hypothetical protein
MGCFDVEKAEGGCVIYERCHENCPALCEIISTDANPNCHEWRWFPDRISTTPVTPPSKSTASPGLSSTTTVSNSFGTAFGTDVGQWIAVFVAVAIAAVLLLLCCKFSVTLYGCCHRCMERWLDRVRGRRSAVAVAPLPNHDGSKPQWTALPMPDDVPDFSMMRLPPTAPTQWPPQEQEANGEIFWSHQEEELRCCLEEKREREEKEKRHQQELDLWRRFDEEERRRQEQEEEHRRQQIDHDNEKYFRRLQENFRVLVDTNRRQEQERYRQGPQMVVVAPSGTFPPN